MSLNASLSMYVWMSASHLLFCMTNSPQNYICPSISLNHCGCLVHSALFQSRCTSPLTILEPISSSTSQTNNHKLKGQRCLEKNYSLSPTMRRFTVRLPGGRIIDLDEWIENPVNTLRSESGIPTGRPMLLDGVRLDDNRKLSSYNINDGSTLHLGDIESYDSKSNANHDSSYDYIKSDPTHLPQPDHLRGAPVAQTNLPKPSRIYGPV
jgi:hypothetical protein